MTRIVSVPELMTLLVMAEGLSRDALECRGERTPEDLAAFRISLRDVTTEAFPGASDVARLAFGAFLCAARAYAHPTNGPEARTACAPVLFEAAKAADHFLTLHRTAQAEPWRRQFEKD